LPLLENTATSRKLQALNERLSHQRGMVLEPNLELRIQPNMYSYIWLYNGKKRHFKPNICLYIWLFINFSCLIDPFTLFHLTWLEGNRRPLDAERWVTLHSTPAWHAWSGYAFEMTCFQHLRQIKMSLGISGIQSESTSWRHDSIGPDDQGAQVDLLIDRRDRVVNLCEIKFTNDPFTISAKYAKELRNKEAVFKKKTGTKKAIFITLISAQVLEQNSHSVGLVSNTVTADALFS
jgi:hypothetical protein